MERKNLPYPFGRFHISREWRIKWRDNPIRKIEKLKDWRRIATLRNPTKVWNHWWKNQKVVIAKMVYLLWNWPIEEGKYVYHIDWDMDNNTPENLTLWNMYDMTENKKSRWKLHHQINTKLTWEQVKNIKKEYKKKRWTYDRSVSYKTLWKKYGVAPQTIGAIIAGISRREKRDDKILYVKPK